MIPVDIETNLNMISFLGGYWRSSLNAANPTHIGKHIDIMEELFPADYIDLFVIGVMIW